MITVTLYVRKNDVRCLEVQEDLKALQVQIPHQVALIDVDTDAVLAQRYGETLPVVQVGPYVLRSPFTLQELQVVLGAARDRLEHLDQIGDKAYERRREQAMHWSGFDTFALWFSNHYMWVISFLLALYVGLPFLAPVMMKSGATGAANVIYAIYRPLCHQLPYRSVFLYGEQPFYPRELAGVAGYRSFEQATGMDVFDVVTVRYFVGNDTMGYKVALCERDIAIWGALLLGGILFALTGRRWKSLNFWVWVLIGLIPIGLDGGSQLLGFLTNMPAWVPVRESTPWLRFLTGALFGFTTAWFMFPLIEENMSENRRVLLQKKTVLAQVGAKNAN